MSVFLQYGAPGKVPGSATEKGHEKWIQISDFSFGAHRNVAGKTGSAKDRESTVPSINEISFTKPYDDASVLLHTEGHVGKGQTAKIELTRTGPNGAETFMKYLLENTLVSSYHFVSSGEMPTESYTLNFTKHTETYTGQDLQGNQTSPQTTNYDQATATSGTKPISQ
jgi:type VI protein secretion system component Hcp